MLQPSPLSPSFTHYLPCSDGDTALSALEWLTYNDTADVAAYLRSIGALEEVSQEDNDEDLEHDDEYEEVPEEDDDEDVEQNDDSEEDF